MPVITIKDPNSHANGKLAFWFDTNKPRRAPKKEKNKSHRRLNKFRKANGERPLGKSEIHSYHHLPQDRSVGNYEILFACTDDEQHNRIELQSTELFTTLFNMGKIGFDYQTKKYFVADEELEKDIQSWLEQGQPKNWVIHDKPARQQMKLLHRAQ